MAKAGIEGSGAAATGAPPSPSTGRWPPYSRFRMSSTAFASGFERPPFFALTAKTSGWAAASPPAAGVDCSSTASGGGGSAGAARAGFSDASMRLVGAGVEAAPREVAARAATSATITASRPPIASTGRLPAPGRAAARSSRRRSSSGLIPNCAEGGAASLGRSAGVSNPPTLCRAEGGRNSAVPAFGLATGAATRDACLIAAAGPSGTVGRAAEAGAANDFARWLAVGTGGGDFSTV